jgi:hypothetical protein
LGFKLITGDANTSAKSGIIGEEIAKHDGPGRFAVVVE